MQKFDTGGVMKNIFHHLIRDFRVLLKNPGFASAASAAFAQGIPEFRDFDFAEKGEYFFHPLHFKCKRQIEYLFKRFRFKEDKYTDIELQLMAEEKFLTTQKSVLAASAKPFSKRVRMVLDIAEKVVADILGEFDVNEFEQSCSFAKRATVGNPYIRSHLDVKLGEDLITGSRFQLDWFTDLVDRDPLLDSSLTAPPFKYWRDRKKLVHSVPIEFVPKSYKSLRTIRKNTLVGSFATAGIGKMIRRRLKRAGLNIQRLQNIHRKLVVAMSVDRKHVTADLSAASDSFFERLVRYLLPHDWFKIIDSFRIRRSKVGDETVKLASFMTMGEGHTFPLQTLLFYSILIAIQQLTGESGRISVYGDDLIYPTRMHKYVSGIFTDLGFSLNQEKTYVWQNFRESCGEDAYMGLPVRPWNPEGVQSEISRDTEFSAFLYQCINGLLERWKWCEIPQTMWYLTLELSKSSLYVFQVPPDFPDYSGIRTRVIEDHPYFPWSPVVLKRPNRENGWQWQFGFRHIKAVLLTQGVHSQVPFIWNKVRPAWVDDENSVVFDEYHEPIVFDALRKDTVENIPGDFEVLEDIPVLRWAYTKCKPWTSKLTKQRFKYRLMPKYYIKGVNSFANSSSVVQNWG